MVNVLIEITACIWWKLVHISVKI